MTRVIADSVQLARLILDKVVRSSLFDVRSLVATDSPIMCWKANGGILMHPGK